MTDRDELESVMMFLAATLGVLGVMLASTVIWLALCLVAS
jgi:hypothetical protein